MSERREAQAKQDARASGAEPRTESRVRERGWRPTTRTNEYAMRLKEAARRRVVEATDKARFARFAEHRGGRG